MSSRFHSVIVLDNFKEKGSSEYQNSIIIFEKDNNLLVGECLNTGVPIVITRFTPHDFLGDFQKEDYILEKIEARFHNYHRIFITIDAITLIKDIVDYNTKSPQITKEKRLTI